MRRAGTRPTLVDPATQIENLTVQVNHFAELLTASMQSAARIKGELEVLRDEFAEYKRQNPPRPRAEP